MSDKTSNHTTGHRHFGAVAWLAVVAVATAAAALAVPRYRRSYRGI